MTEPEAGPGAEPVAHGDAAPLADPRPTAGASAVPTDPSAPGRPR